MELNDELELPLRRQYKVPSTNSINLDIFEDSHEDHHRHQNGHEDNHLSSYDLKQRLIRDGRLNKSQLKQFRPAPLRSTSAQSSFPSGIELNSMSVASLYDIEGRESKDMDMENEVLLMNSNEGIGVDVDEDLELDDYGSYETNESGDYESNNNTARRRSKLNSTSSKINGNSNLYYDDCPRNPFDKDSNKVTKTLLFEDGIRSIDFVLVWKTDDNVVEQRERDEKRKIFQQNLINEGLEMEFDIVQEDLHFGKIHAPVEVLRRYSEILKLRMPMKESLCKITELELSKTSRKLNRLSSAAHKITSKGIKEDFDKVTGVAEKINHNIRTIAFTTPELKNRINYTKNFPYRLHLQESRQVHPESPSIKNAWASMMTVLCDIENEDFRLRRFPGIHTMQSKSHTILEQFRGVTRRLIEKVLVDEHHFPPLSHRFTAVYSRDKEYLFDLKQASFFTSTVRSRIVQFILDRKRFSNNAADDYAFGIDRLITEQVYVAAYPLHDGELNTPGSMRSVLCNEWAAVSKWYRYQPLDYIKDYFGVKIGLYFAWLGFYTFMLMLAAVVGVLCFIYSWITLENNKPSLDVCDTKNNFTMCPLCDKWCDYWDIAETCVHARVTNLFDNSTTVFFAVFMSFWATLFLEMWKRYSAEITHRWDLTGFDVQEEHPRPQYIARLSRVQRTRVNMVTLQSEPEVPFWRMKLPATIFSFSIVMLLIVLAIVAVLGVVLYRISIMATLAAYGDKVTTSLALFFTTATAATINLLLIVVFNWLYTYLAEYLTEFELLRTQTEFDDSLTLKIYLLQFVNYYASIFYIAFFKGKFIGHPGKFVKFFDFRQEECGLGGCLMELCIQLAIIMVGKQTLNTVLEMIMPKFERWYILYSIRNGKSRDTFAKGQERWIRDLKLAEWGPRSLFPEYLEMVLQYGFVTIFVAAFPLAPFFALLNNMLEMRLDAKKLLTHHRRPVGQRVHGIGVWYRILDSIGKLSVITNAFIIAFTSDFIPRMVYRISVSNDTSLTNYLNYSLAYFNTSDWEEDSGPRNPNPNVTLCRYPDFRVPPWEDNKYARTTTFWHILAAKLAFVVVFENFVAFVMIFVKWVIPDMSTELRDQIRREAYITNEIIIKQETLRASGLRNQMSPREQTAKLIKMETLMDPSLSGSQLDLVIHGGPDDPIAPGHCPPDKYRGDNDFLDAETGRNRKSLRRSNDAIEPVSL